MLTNKAKGVCTCTLFVGRLSTACIEKLNKAMTSYVKTNICVARLRPSAERLVISVVPSRPVCVFTLGSVVFSQYFAALQE